MTTRGQAPRVRRDLRARAAYAEGAGIYRILPRAVATPETTDELIVLVRSAVRAGMPLTPRGAGSGMAGGNVGPGMIVDLTRLDGAPLAVGSDGVAHAGAAVTWNAMAQAAGPLGFRVLPDPSSGRVATVGGMIATNAAGPRTLRHGAVRAHVEAVTAVTADGDLVEFRRGAAPDAGVAAVSRFVTHAAPRLREAAPLVRERLARPVRKSSSGYALDGWLASGDILDLVIGSEGTLAVVTGAEWRLDPIPAARRGLQVALARRALLPEVLDRLLPAAPAAVELLDASFLRFVAQEGHGMDPGVPDQAEALLLAEFEGAEDAGVEAALQEAVAALSPVALAVRASSTPAEHDRLWAVRHAASPILSRLGDRRRSLQVIEDACVPRERLGDYLAAIEASADRHRVPFLAFGHAGDGHVHVNLLPDLTESDWEGRVAAVYREVSTAALGLGGVLSGEHGDGRLRSPWLEATFGAEVVALFRAVKEAFDPAGILNPGVKLPDGRSPLADLKVGPDAVELPGDIADALRRIERAAGYDRFRLDLAGPA